MTSKGKGKADISSDRSESNVDSSSETERDLLELLQQQCAASLGLNPAKRPRLSEELEDTLDDSQEEEEWTGCASEDEDQVEMKSLGPVITFQDPSRASYTAEAGSKERYRNFMSSSVSKQLQPKASTSKAAQKEDTDDIEMRKLDSTLQSMIATLPSSSFTSSTDRLVHAPVQKNTPLPLRRALQQTRLARLKAESERDRQSGRVISKKKADVALTKKDMRLQNGAEEKRRRDARGIGGNAGRMKGGTLVLNKEEIRKGAAGLPMGSRPAKKRRK